MPYGRSVCLWAVCDNCSEGIDSQCEGGVGSKVDAAVLARKNGWLVCGNGRTYCPDCREKVKKTQRRSVDKR